MLQILNTKNLWHRIDNQSLSAILRLNLLIYFFRVQAGGRQTARKFDQKAMFRRFDFRALGAGLLHLMYPCLCVACGDDLPAGKSCFCFSCRLKLEPTGMHLQEENDFTHRLWGQLPLVHGAAMYYFTRKSPIQRALHQLKYHNKPEVGIKLGREMGYLLAQSPFYRDIEVVVPVPLHPRKEQLRGYNQSAMFAEGVAEVLGIAFETRSLARKIYSESQTKKKRLDRFVNVETSFVVTKPSAFVGRHILLVDDVLTTGATLESCGQTILAVQGARLSLATIAIAV